MALGADGTKMRFIIRNVRTTPLVSDEALILEVKKRPALYRDIFLVAGSTLSEREVIWSEIRKSIPGKSNKVKF